MSSGTTAGYNAEQLELLADYEEVLVGKKAYPDNMYFAKASPQVAEERALFLFKYWIETYMQWSPKKAADSLSMDYIRQWKLHPILQYIRFPTELNPKKDLFWIAHKLYGDKVGFSDQTRYLTTYTRIISGDLKKWPKNYFRSDDGDKKVSVCLKYAIENYLTPRPVSDIYAFFGSPECKAWLDQYKLTEAIKAIFDYPITAFHMLLPEEQRNEPLYQMYRFITFLRNEKVPKSA